MLSLKYDHIFLVEKKRKKKLSLISFISGNNFLKNVTYLNRNL